MRSSKSNCQIYSTSLEKKKEESLCCLSNLLHIVCTGCSLRTAVTVSRIEQMSPLKAFFSYGPYYHHEIKLKTCPFCRYNDRVILGR